ncbi:MAG TPA: ABC transporter ATP-binding protein [Microscillaceae bacterium]|nr:ABC transporter ATP-binding protein [Microscillaceae bacterium]
MDYILEAQGVSKKYASHQALQEVSLQIPKQSIYGLLGPNGAGKTTFIRIITQIIPADSGEIRFEGELLAPKHIGRIGYLPEERGLYKKMKVGEQLLYLAQLKGLTYKQALEKAKAWMIKFDIKEWWNKAIQDLSKGMQQKIQFIATVMHEPTLIILDEPFSGFDPINANLIRDEILQLRAQGCTIIFSTHRMETVEELCDEVALIHQSRKVLDGSKHDIKQRYKPNHFRVQYTGNQLLPTTTEQWEVLSDVALLGSQREAMLQRKQTGATNPFLQALMEQADIQVFEEQLPEMSEIFIRVVEENTPSSADNLHPSKK